MMQRFSEQVRLLVSVLPLVAEEECFALKGGTAINLFIRDMPRLSVDIDLAYLLVQNREESMDAIDRALKRIKERLISRFPYLLVSETVSPGTDKTVRLTPKNDQAQIKIEVTPVLRGSVNPVMVKSLCEKASRQYGSVEMQLLSFEDLYGGKICAALDRQHPRDLYDVHYLLHNEGLTQELKNTFLVYLLSHPRPIAELLAPHFKKIDTLYEKEFAGMTLEPVTLEELIKVREELIVQIHRSLDERDREFILSFKAGRPRWELFAFAQAQHLPAIRWKLVNLAKMQKRKRQEALKKLEDVLSKKRLAL